MKKFRVWDKKEQKMYCKGFYITPDGKLLWRNDAEPKEDSYILEQSIGKKDKKGTEVFEGDIISAEYEDLLGEYHKVVGVVEMDNLAVMLDFPNQGISVPMVHFNTDDPDDFEIIGNIHNNYNLLEE